MSAPEVLVSRVRKSPSSAWLRALALAGLLAVSAVTPLQRAVASPTQRAQYHLTVPDHWMNDPQRPLWINGSYNLYTLYDKDYLTGGGTDGTGWRWVTSADGASFTDRGVAAPEWTQPNGDLWSGSPVVDSANTAGFGAGAVVALITQPDRVGGSNAQSQFLWYSTDGGKRFQPVSDRPVIANPPGHADFRDPKVVWDGASNRWVAAIAANDRLMLYTSPNLRDWTWRSDSVHAGIGTLECPDIFQMRADDGTLHWVIAASAHAPNGPNTYAYWTGTFDGVTFQEDSPTPAWLDYGFDWYAAVTWEDHSSTNLDSRLAMGWMNNWAYAHDVPPTVASDGFNGTDSIVRQLRLAHQPNGSYALLSQPVSSLDDHVTSTTTLPTTTVNGQQLLPFTGDAYELTADVSWSALNNVGFQLRRSGDGARHVDVGVYNDYFYLNRTFTNQPDTTGTMSESRTPFNPADKQVHVRILVDRTSVEVFVNDGLYVHSSEVFPDPSDTGIALYTDGGSAIFSNMRVRQFADAMLPPPPAVTAPITLVANTSKCVDRDVASGNVQVWDCLGNANQSWSLQPDGRLTTGGTCLQAVGTGNQSPVTVGTCTGAPNQQWSVRDDGTLVNQGSFRCLDVDSGNVMNGRQLQIWDCLANANQQWNAPH